MDLNCSKKTASSIWPSLESSGTGCVSRSSWSAWTQHSRRRKQLIPHNHTNFSRSFYTTEKPCNPQMNNPAAIREIHTYIHTKCISTFNAPLRRSIYRRCPGMLAPAVSRGRRYTAVQTTNISSGRGKVRSQYICARLDKLVSRSDGSTARTLLPFVLWHYQSIIPGGSGQQQKEEGFQTAAV